MADNDQGVVELVSAGVPADQGLSALGLMMQLAGSVMAAYAALLSFMLLFNGGGGGDLTIWMMLVLALCLTRSMYQRAAGTEILYGRRTMGDPDAPQEPLRGVKRYIVIALCQTLLLVTLLGWKFHLPGMFAVALGAGLAVWPVTLAVILAFPRFARFKQSIPASEDKGFEGTAILMTILGACGACSMATVLTQLLKLPGAILQQGPMVLLLITLGLLLVRSLIHVQAGVSGLRETNIDRAVELANRYANFGVISSFCAGGAMLLIAMTTHVAISGLTIVVGMCWMLMSWPLIVRRFYSERQFSDLLAGDDAPVHRRSPDAGLTGLGWFLIAHAAFTATFVVPQLLLGIGNSHGMGDLQDMLALAGSNVGSRSIWWNVGLIVLQVWAGYELVRMSAQHRAIANIYALVSAAVNIYLLLPIFDLLKHAGGDMFSATAGLRLGLVAIWLVVPVSTFILINRRMSPTARARFRPRAAAPSTPAAPAAPPAPVAPVAPTTPPDDAS